VVYTRKEIITTEPNVRNRGFHASVTVIHAKSSASVAKQQLPPCPSKVLAKLSTTVENTKPDDSGVSSSLPSQPVVPKTAIIQKKTESPSS
jgi:hypothetical protein